MILPNIPSKYLSLCWCLVFADGQFLHFLQIMGIKSKTFNAPAANGSATSGSRMKRLKLTDKEKQRLQERIKKASSLEEIIRLEKELEEGRLPAGIMGDDAMEE